MERRVRGSTEPKDRNDAAVALIFQGRYLEAVEALEQLERATPGELLGRYDAVIGNARWRQRLVYAGYAGIVLLLGGATIYAIRRRWIVYRRA